MSSGSHGVGKYLFVGAALLVLTAVTILASYIQIGVALGIALALLIAGFKSSLVASFFMHLIEEKKLIYVILGFTVFFFLGMILLIFAGYYDVYDGLHYESQSVPSSIH